MTGLYCIYDSLAEEAGPIFQAANDAVAARSFRNVVKDFKEGRQDYTLMKLGTYDEKSVKLDGLDEALVIPGVYAAKEATE